MFLKKYILTALFITTGVVGVFATPPRDAPRHHVNNLIYNGDTMALSLSFLPSDLLNRPPRCPDGWHSTDSLLLYLFGDRNFCRQRVPGCNRFMVMWEIYENQLYLTGIRSCRYEIDSVQADLISVFGDKVVNGRVKADWIGGSDEQGTEFPLEAIGGVGGFFYYNDFLVFEKEMFFEFYEGQLRRVDTFYHPRLRPPVSREKINRFVYSTIDWDNLPEIREPIRVGLSFRAIEGRIEDVSIASGMTAEREPFNQEALRVVSSIPYWSIIYRRGEPFPRFWAFTVVFSQENRERYGR